MLHKGENDYEIEHFGLKLMTSSKSVNKIPDYYLSLAQNARLYDTGIGPRRGKQLFIKGQEEGINNGAFILNGTLYQIASGLLYKINEDKTKTLVGDTGFTNKINVITYHISKFYGVALISSPGERIKVFNGSSISLAGNDTIVELNFWDADAQFPEGTYFAARDESNTDKGYWSIKGSGYTHLHDRYSQQLVAGLMNGELRNSLNMISNDGTYVGKNIYNITTSYIDGGNIEHIFGHFFNFRKNILYIAAKINSGHSSNICNYIGAGSKRLYFENDIIAIKSSMSGLYIFTEKKVYFLNKSSLSYASNNAITDADYSILGEAGIPLNSFLLVSVGDKIIYLTKGLNIAQISYMEGTNVPGIGDLSTKPNAGIKSLLDNLDENQDTGFAYYNERERTVQFHLKIKGSTYNNICFIYDLINETWAVDTNRNYNAIIEYKNKLYGFSSKDTNIYIDDVGCDDDGEAIDFKILTQALNFDTSADKFFQGFFLSGGVSENTSLKTKVYIDGSKEYEQTFTGQDIKQQEGDECVDLIAEGIFKNSNDENKLYNFTYRADAGTLNKSGEKIMIEISSNSQTQNFILDKLGVIKMNSKFIQTKNKF